MTPPAQKKPGPKKLFSPTLVYVPLFRLLHHDSVEALQVACLQLKQVNPGSQF